MGAPELRRELDRSFRYLRLAARSPRLLATQPSPNNAGDSRARSGARIGNVPPHRRPPDETASRQISRGVGRIRDWYLGGPVQRRVKMPRRSFVWGAPTMRRTFPIRAPDRPENPGRCLGWAAWPIVVATWQPAAKYLERSVQFAPQFRSAHTLLAEVCRRLGDQQQADQQQELAARLSPNMNWPDPYIELGGKSLRGQKQIVNRATRFSDRTVPRSPSITEGNAPAAIDGIENIFSSADLRETSRIRSAERPSAKRCA